MPIFPERCTDPDLTDDNGIAIYDENGYSFYGDYDPSLALNWSGVLKIAFLAMLIVAAIFIR